MNLAATLNIQFSTIKKYKFLESGFDLRAIWIFSMALLMFSLAFYLFQVTGASQKSYLVLQQETLLNKLSSDIETLEFNFLARHSAKSIESLAKSTGFEEVGRIHYIRLPGQALVAAK